MSKLFDTLEQIRRNESYQVSAGIHKKLPADAGRPWAFRRILILVAMIGFAAVFASQLKFTGQERRYAAPVDSAGPGVTVTSPVVVPPSAYREPEDLEGQDVVSINNLAVKHVENHDHWRGIYMLSNILARDPDNVEATINISTALAELGLTEPAKRYLRQALALDRNNPDLQNNIAILKKAGVLGKDFL